MGVLGLDQQEYRDDNLFKRLLWPSNNPSETDTLGQQGFWICLIIAVLSMVQLAIQRQTLAGLLVLLFFLLGGIGVREHSVAAAVLVAAAKVLDLILGLWMGLPPGALAILVIALLVANIRGTWIASRWKQHYGTDIMPERMGATFTDRLVDQMPARVWPWGRFVFLAVAVLYVCLVLLGALGIAIQRAKHPAAPPPSTELQVDPTGR